MTPAEASGRLDTVAADLDRLYGRVRDVIDQLPGRRATGLLTTLDIGKQQAGKLSRRVRRWAERDEDASRATDRSLPPANNDHEDDSA